MHETILVDCVQSVAMTIIMALEMVKEVAMKAVVGAFKCAWIIQGGGMV